jgi:hypothetical protein
MLSRDRLLDSGPVTFVAFTEVIAADSCVVGGRQVYRRSVKLIASGPFLRGRDQTGPTSLAVGSDRCRIRD